MKTINFKTVNKSITLNEYCLQPFALRFIKLIVILIILFTLFLTRNPLFSQENNLNAVQASSFAKDFGRRMYNKFDLQDYKDGYSFSINKWKPLVNPNGKKHYLIDIEVSWKTKLDGFSGWEDVEYNGVLLVDEFGCKPIFFIKDKKESRDIFRSKSPVYTLKETHISEFEAIDKWFLGVKYSWSAGDCLD